MSYVNNLNVKLIILIIVIIKRQRLNEASTGNRTRKSSLEGWCYIHLTIEAVLIYYVRVGNQTLI